jgi:RNA polymerase sigma-70 factor (ECF subfamily)
MGATFHRWLGSKRVSLNPTLPLPATLAREVVIDATVLRARDGDPDAFARLYDLHAPRVHAVCLRLCGDPTRAGELLQDVFVRAWERLDSFRGESAFGTWLHRLAVNVVLQRARGDHRRVRRVALGDDLAPSGVDGPTRTLEPGLRLDLEQAVAGLPEFLREVFVLHDVEGYQHGEIAAVLKIPIGTSRSHLFRARRLLREVLS